MDAYLLLRFAHLLGLMLMSEGLVGVFTHFLDIPILVLRIGAVEGV